MLQGERSLLGLVCVLCAPCWLRPPPQPSLAVTTRRMPALHFHRPCAVLDRSSGLEKFVPEKLARTAMNKNSMKKAGLHYFCLPGLAFAPAMCKQ